MGMLKLLKKSGKNSKLKAKEMRCAKIGRHSTAFGFWKQAAIAIARERPERAEAFSREAVGGGCSAARLSSGIGGLQQPTMLAEHQFAKPSNTDIDLLVGSVDESDDMHLARHAGVKNCFRCVVILNRARIARDFPWASERPSHLGGPWRFGCHICAAAFNIPVERRRMYTGACRPKWANFQVAEMSGSIASTRTRFSRYKQAYTRLSQHARSNNHLIAARHDTDAATKGRRIAAHHDSNARPAAVVGLVQSATQGEQLERSDARSAEVAAPVQPAAQGQQSDPAAPGEQFERPVHSKRCAKQQLLTRWISPQKRCSPRQSNGIGKAATPDVAFREQVEQHVIRPAADAKPDVVFRAQVEQHVKCRSGQTRWAAKPGPPQPGRRMSVRLADLMRYGYTSGCIRCEYLKRYTSGGTTTVHHSEACRTRIEEALAKDSHHQARFIEKLRMDLLLAELGEQQLQE